MSMSQQKLEKKESLKYFRNMLRFFIRNGKKSIIENNMFKYINLRLQKRNLMNKQSFFKLLLQSRNNLLQHVKLKMWRRGRRIKYKVVPLLNEKPNKKALLSFVKLFREGKYKKFIVHFSKELEMAATGQSSVVSKRNEIYKKAFKIFRVRRKRLKKNSNVRNKKNITINKELKKKFNAYSKENLNQIVKKAFKKNIGKKSKQILKKYLDEQKNLVDNYTYTYRT